MIECVGGKNFAFQPTASIIAASWKYVETTKFNLSSSVKNYITYLNRNEGKSEIYNFSPVSRVTRSGLLNWQEVIQQGPTGIVMPIKSPLFCDEWTIFHSIGFLYLRGVT
jgi:hypothetical protein